MMKIQYIIVVMMLFSSCCDYKNVIKNQLSFQGKYSSSVYQCYNLRIYNYKEIYQDGINGLSVDFISNDHMDIDKARMLILENVTYLFEQIKSHPWLSPFLAKSFDLNKICLTVIFFEKNSDDYVAPPCIAYVNYLNGKIGYSITNEKRVGLEMIHVETYEEALQIINAQK